jgi:hypothetical protein
MRPMSEFDPTPPALVHDQLNDQMFRWEPERHGRDWQRSGPTPWRPGVVEWDGLLLDGWMPVEGSV